MTESPGLFPVSRVHSRGLRKLSKNILYMQHYLEEKRKLKRNFGAFTEDFKQWASVSKPINFTQSLNTLTKRSQYFLSYIHEI